MRVSAHVASPSRHTLYTGEMIVEGLLRPIEQGIGRASDAAGRLTGAAIGGRVPNRHLAVGGGAAARGGDGAELLDELRALRMELVAQRTYFADLVRATRGLPSGIGHEITKAGDYRFAPRELRTN